MRGPFLAGVVGSRLVLERLAARLAPRLDAQCDGRLAEPVGIGERAVQPASTPDAPGPVLVLSTIWLAQALAEVMPVILLVEGQHKSAARRSARKRRSFPLTAIVAGGELPLRTGAAGALVLEGLLDLEAADARPFIEGLLPFVRPGGLLVALDGTKNPEHEADLTALFLAAGFVHISQEHPRDGAVITVGAAPAAEVIAARIQALGLTTLA